MSSFVDSLGLNKEQKAAVLHDEGSQLVFAGAGTGKTKVLTAKIAWLIRERGIRPGEIFAATFTNKAAAEMKERISALIHMPCDALWIGTFHSLCVKILRRESDKLGYSRWFSIYDSSDQLALMKSVLKSADVDENTLQPKAVLHAVSSYKNKGLTSQQCEDQATSFYEREMAHLYSAYQRELKAADAMDFDDLIANVVILFKTSSETLLQYQGMFQHVLVDEYQDTNHSQFQMIKSLAGEINPVFAVGDDDQSIYGWRGAQVENILNFEKSFSDTKVFKLERNYRSTQPILAFANSVISNNTKRAKKQLWTEMKSTEDVRVCGYSDDRMEASKTVTEIRRSIDTDEVKPQDVAILFRTNAQSRLFEDALRKNNVPYVLVGGTSFYERKEIKDLLAYLKLLANPKDSVSCQRILNIPARGIGARSQEKVALRAREMECAFFEVIKTGEAENAVTGKAKKGLGQFKDLYAELDSLMVSNATVDQILNEVISMSGYVDDLDNGSEEARSRVENINELVNALTEWQEGHREAGLREFLEEITLASAVDTYDGDKSVSLMTLHTAKGLEFPWVYLVGLEDGLLPSRQNFDDLAKLEEECRLLYVGITRAEKQLICSFAESRMRFGSIMPMGQSRFLKGIPEDLYRFVDETARYSTVSWEDEWQAPARRQRPAGSRGATGIGSLKRGSEIRTRPKAALPDSSPLTDDFNQDVVLFRIGQKVEQSKYGVGKIMNLSGFGADLRITVLFESGVRKQLLAKFAKLKPL